MSPDVSPGSHPVQFVEAVELLLGGRQELRGNLSRSPSCRIHADVFDVLIAWYSNDPVEHGTFDACKFIQANIFHFGGSYKGIAHLQPSPGLPDNRQQAKRSSLESSNVLLLQSDRSIKQTWQLETPAKNTCLDNPYEKKSMISDTVIIPMSCHVLTVSPCHTCRTLPAKWLHVLLNPQQPGEILGLGSGLAI